MSAVKRIGLYGALMGSVVLSGCMSATYYTEQGTPVTHDTMALLESNPNNPILPYSQGEAHFDAFPWMKQAQKERYRESEYGPKNEMDEVADYWSSDEAHLPPLDISVTGQKREMDGLLFGRIFANVLVSAFTLYLIPVVAPQEYHTTIEMRSGDHVVYSGTSHFKGNMYMSWFPIGQVRGMNETQSAMWYASLLSHEEQLGRRIYAEQPLYDNIKRMTDAEQVIASLDNPDLRFYRNLTMQHLAGLLAGYRRNARYQAYYRVVDAHPEFASVIQGEDKLLFVGPEGAQIRDLMASSGGKRSDSVAAASIRAAAQPYKVFNQAERDWLKSRRLPDDVVAAMVEVSAAPVQTAVVAADSATIAAAGAAPTTADTPEGGLEATATACTKAYAAKKACEQIPGDPFGLIVRGCIAQVKKKFGGLNCPIPL